MRLLRGAPEDTSANTCAAPVMWTSFSSGLDTVHTPSLVVRVPCASSLYEPPSRSVVSLWTSAGGQDSSGRHLPVVTLWMANGGSSTFGLMPARYWSYQRMTSSYQPLRPMASLLPSISAPRTWFHGPSQPRSGPVWFWRNSATPSGAVLFSVRPWVMNTGTSEPLTLVMMLRWRQ